MVSQYIRFGEDDFEDEDDLLQAMIEFQRGKEELSVNEKEQHSVWTLKKLQRRKGMQHFQYQTLRDVLKEEDDRMKEFRAKYREVRVQTSRDKNVSIQYSSAQGEEGVSSSIYTGTNSFSSRRRSQDDRNKRESNTRGQDSRGRNYFRTYERSILQNR